MRYIKINLLSLIIMMAATMAYGQNAVKIKPTHQFFQFAPDVHPGDYMAKTVIFKVKPQFRSECQVNAIHDVQLNSFLQAIGVQSLAKIYPRKKPPVHTVNRLGQHYVDLSLIYQFRYTSQADITDVINHLYQFGLFQYVQPHYLQKECYTPNDPSVSAQYALTNIKAYQGWGISKGDTNTVIGIVDTGTELTHSDLKGNIKHNYADPIDGIDNDGDGYVDNFNGWDVAMNDNDPTWQGNQHGVHVCGIADAVTDNNNGIAGVGFNCKFLPVKIADASGTLTASYQGITYAADHGCSVINCSWGGTGGGQYGQDIINYATINDDALVVAAAGNNSSDQDFYPASFNYVISVASTDNADHVSSFSNYGYNVDVCAPGSNIYSTWNNNSYTYESGTSMASPCAAGVAAIIRSYFPSYTALQAGERLKVTCDNIYSLQASTYANKLGDGRVDMYNALTAPATPSVVMTSRNVTDNNDNAFVVGDTLRITGDFTNYLAPTGNLTATISSTSPYVNIIHATTTLGVISTMGVKNNNADPFQVVISSATPQNQSILFKVNMTDGTYSANVYFSVIANVDYINVTVNDIGTSFTSKGLIGYNSNSQSQGLGFTYNNSGTLLYEAGLMVGVSSTQVSDMVRGAGSTPDNDFQSVVKVHQVIPAVVSDFDVDGEFNDNGAPTPLPILVDHKSFAWSSPGNQKYVIVQYEIKNTGTAALSNLYAGIFADWDIDASTYAQDRAAFDSINKMGYAYYTGANGTYTGIKLLTNSAPVVDYAIDNDSTGDGGVNMFDGYSIAEKYTTLSTNRYNAGMSGSGDDIIDVVSSGPFNLNPGDTAVVAFALIAGDSLSDLQNSAANAQIKYNTDVPLGIAAVRAKNDLMLNQNFPNPASSYTTITFNLPKADNIKLNLYDLMGRRIATIVHGMLQRGEHSYYVSTADLASGMYYYRLQTSSKTLTKKMMIVK